MALTQQHYLEVICAKQKFVGNHQNFLPLACEHWHPPPNGAFKCNLDAAIFNDLHSFGTRLCIRGADDNLLYAQTKHRN